MNKYIAAYLLLNLLFIPFTYSQPKYDIDKINDYITAAVDSFDVPGMAVGIIKNSEVLLNKGYGVRSTESMEEVDNKTLFGIASLSKAFTAASIGMLVDDGKLDWNDRVIDHLPWFRLHDPYITSELTIVDLLCHRAGLATFDGDLLWYGTDYTRNEIAWRIRELPIKNSFRSQYGYQNVMFIVAGEVIKEISGKTWEEFVLERIFDPLKMAESTTSNSKFGADDNVAVPHLDGNVQNFINYDNSGPAASINSNVDDLLKWAQFWVDKGSAGDKKILSENSYYKITRSYQALNGGRGEEIGGRHFTNTGLGWFLSDYAGRKVISHGGGLPGFLSRIIIIPEDSLGIVILQNDMKGAYSAVANKILDEFLTKKNVDYITQYLDKSKIRKASKKQKEEKRNNSKVAGTNPSYPLENYTGSYEDKMYGEAKIVVEDGKLQISLLPSKKLFTSDMEHWHFDTFKIKFTDAFLPSGYVTFNKNSDGEVIDFTIDLPNPDFHFYNLKFIKK